MTPDELQPALPPRLAVDADGFVWRVYDDDTWSMARINPDNSPIPQPVTFYEPEPVRVGICGARLHYPSSYDGANVLCVCTKRPDHFVYGDTEHEDGTRGGAPKAKWENPS